MIPYVVCKRAPSSSHLTRELVKYVPDRVCFYAVSSQNGDKVVTSPPPPPQSLNGSFDLLSQIILYVFILLQYI